MAKSKDKTPAPSDRDMAADLLLKEADEALRQDQMNAFWDEWGSTIIGVAAMIVLGTIIGVGWQKWKTAQRISNTSSLIMVQNNPDADVELKGSYRGIADMIEAARLASEENTNSTKITRLLDDAANTKLPSEWKILAEWGALRSRSDAAETADTNEIRDMNIALADDMISLAKKRNNPYSAAILMEAGVLYGENGDPQTAVRLLQEAKNDETASAIADLSDRIDSYLHLYTMESTQ